MDTCEKCGEPLAMIQRNEGMHPDCRTGEHHEVLKVVK